jgi:hypothetical protein
MSTPTKTPTAKASPKPPATPQTKANTPAAKSSRAGSRASTNRTPSPSKSVKNKPGAGGNDDETKSNAGEVTAPVVDESELNITNIEPIAEHTIEEQPEAEEPLVRFK